jgi:hypothetical protein
VTSGNAEFRVSEQQKQQQPTQPRTCSALEAADQHTQASSAHLQHPLRLIFGDWDLKWSGRRGVSVSVARGLQVGACASKLLCPSLALAWQPHWTDGRLAKSRDFDMAADSAELRSQKANIPSQ